MSKGKKSIGGVLWCLVVFSLEVSAEERPRFQGPFTISDISRPVTVHAGDVDGNGKLDLVASNGTDIVTVYFQDSANRKLWTRVPVRVGASCFFTRTGDFDGDGFDDLVVADGGSTTYYIRSRGDQSFDAPVSLPEARGSRWIATGDWNNDGHLDLASSNLANSSLTIFVGDGAGGFEPTGPSIRSGREHTLEALDYDGDGNLDLALGTGIPGIQLHQGQGDGTFVRKNQVPGHNGLLGCVEYIAIGDFNNDGFDDIAPTCIDDQIAYAGVSLGDGTYERILKDPFAAGTESSAVGDLNGDGNDDLALVSHGSTSLRIYLGKGDGSFETIREFGTTGNKPVFLIAEDLDQDGHDDIISADEGSSSLTIFFGREGEAFLESNRSVTGYGSARAYGISDLDKDGLPDFLYTNAIRAEINVYLKPGITAVPEPSFSIPLMATYVVLEVVDLNDDGIVDVVGGNNGNDALHTALLDAEGKARDEQTLVCDGNPKLLRTGLLDEGPTVDVVAYCSQGGELRVFLGNGDGTFMPAPAIMSVERPKALETGDVDGDGRGDVVVASSNAVAIHFSLDGGGFSPASFVVHGEDLSFATLALTDLDGDGSVDVLGGDRGSKSVLFYRNKGAGEFEDPAVIEISTAAPQSTLGTADVDGDGRLDVIVGFSGNQTVDIIYNLGSADFSERQTERVGAQIEFLRILDLNGDGLNDIAAFSRSATGLSLGIPDEPPPSPPSRFLRGDADNDGKVALNDAVAILNHLFRGAGPLACPDAGDSDDDGKVSLTDAVEVLSYLFRGGRSPAAPGAETCGEDPSEDGLGGCSERC